MGTAAKRFSLMVAGGLAISVASAAWACPWHALGAVSPSRSAGGGGWQLVPVVYVLDRMTGQEKRIELGREALSLPRTNGFECRVLPPKDSDLSDTYHLTCSPSPKAGDGTLEQACLERDKPDGRTWNGYDGHGLNVVTVVLACELPPEADDSRT